MHVNAPPAALSALSVALGATLVMTMLLLLMTTTTTAIRVSDNWPAGSSAQQMFDQLASPRTQTTSSSSLQPIEVLGALIQILAKVEAAAAAADDSSAAAAAALKLQVEALINASTLDDSQCSASQQQWLIRQMLKFKQSQLGGYVDLVRQKQRTFCLNSFKTRLDAAIASAGAQSSEQVVQEFAQFLQESASIKGELYKLDDVPMESLIEALRQYIKSKLNLAEVPVMGSHTPSEAEAITLVSGHLMGACQQLTGAYGDFVWMLKLFEPQRPSGLSNGRHERILWLTKVCNSLKFSTFDVRLHESYHKEASLSKSSRKRIDKFCKLLRIRDSFELVFNNKLTPASVNKALEILSTERHFLSQSDESESELLHQVKDELARSCADVQRALGDFLWLIDMRLVSVALDSRESIELLKPARVCELLPKHTWAH